MDGGQVLTESAPKGAVTSACAQVPNQPQQKTREAKCIKTADDGMSSCGASGLSCECSAATCGVHECSTDKLAKDLEVKVNLDNEHFINGLINGTKQDCKCGRSDSTSLSTSSSPCTCSSTNLVHNGASSKELPESDHSFPNKSNTAVRTQNDEIVYVSYESELQMPDIMRIMNKDLSEPYSIYTYRYFIYNWPKLCFLAMIGSETVGAIVCKLDLNRKSAKRGYIAMLAVDSNHRNKGIGSNLVLKAIAAMVALNADEVVLESEITNSPALRLYENLGFVRDKRLFRYYLNGVDAFRLKLWLK